MAEVHLHVNPDVIQRSPRFIGHALESIGLRTPQVAIPEAEDLDPELDNNIVRTIQENDGINNGQVAVRLGELTPEEMLYVYEEIGLLVRHGVIIREVSSGDIDLAQNFTE